MGKSPGMSNAPAAQQAPVPQAPQGPPQMGVINSGQPAGSAPISYYLNQADIPQGQTGLMRPNPAGIGVNMMAALPPPPPPPAPVAAPQPDMRALLAQYLNSQNNNADLRHRGVGSASHGDRQGATTSGRGWGGNSSAGSGYGMGGRRW